MSELPDNKKFNNDPELVASVQRYLRKSMVIAMWCSPFSFIVFLILLTASGDSNAGYGTFVLLFVCAIPSALSLANLAFAAFVAIFSDDTRRVGAIILAIYALVWFLYQQAHR